MQCDLCDGMGMRMVVVEGKRAAEPCACMTQAKIEQTVRRAGIPQRYANASFETFKAVRNGNIGAMFRTVRQYTAEYLPGRYNGGLLLTGTIGTGKTHLAVAALRELILERGQVGTFVDAREMLAQVRSTFTPGSQATEFSVLAPILSADVLVIDELGAARTTDWTADVIEQILNSRYNSQRATILTTNYPLPGFSPLAPANTQKHNLSPYDRPGPMPVTAMQRESLQDRIGARMYSRVREMCVAVQVQGADYRERLARAIAV
jgi:DNA replication protein DnaC